MIEPTKALKDSMIKIVNAVEKGKYSTAGMASTEFIKLAYHLECQNEVFVGEVLEAVCMQMNYEMKYYAVPDEDVACIKDRMSKYMNELLNAYNKQQEMCAILMNLRYYTTKIQFDAVHKYDRRQIRNRRDM